MKKLLTMKVEGKEVTLSNLEKPLYPDGPFLKGEVINYYAKVSEFILPHLKNRPVTLLRFPDGVGGKAFYEKNAPSHTPSWVHTLKIPSKLRKFINYVSIDDLPTLLWAANLASLEFHSFLYRKTATNNPSSIVFDLDPGPKADLLDCCELALRIREFLVSVKLEALPKVSGSKGLQLYIPLNTKTTFEASSAFAKGLAQKFQELFPEKVVANMRKELRTKKVFIDWSQNSSSKTTVCVYSLRAKQSTPYVSFPISWEVLTRALKKGDRESLYFEPEKALKILARTGDQFIEVQTRKQKLTKAAIQSIENYRGPNNKSNTSNKTASSLVEYRRKRDFNQTGEPQGHDEVVTKERIFVIQKHQASHLHFDLRLEMHGTLKSWAVPKGPPMSRSEKRLAMQVEDHPIEYADFEGIIPKGNYGGGTVMVWDYGTYETKETSPLKALGRGKLVFELHGKKLKGEWALIKTKQSDRSWLLIQEKSAKVSGIKTLDLSAKTGRTLKQIETAKDAVWGTKEEEEKSTSQNSAAELPPLTGKKIAPRFIEPMKALLVESPPSGEWLYEIKFDGYRVLAIKDGKKVSLLSRTKNDLTLKFPDIAKAIRSLHTPKAVIDGEIVVLDDSGRPSFQKLQSAQKGLKGLHLLYYAFDLPHFGGHDLTKAPLASRRQLLSNILLEETNETIKFSETLDGDVDKLLASAAKAGLEGLIGKRPDSPYESGRRSGKWIKLKIHNEQEFVIGGFTAPRGSRANFGALLVGYFEKGKLQFAGKVGTGFNESLLSKLYKQFQKYHTEKCPFPDLPEKKAGRYGAGVTLSVMKNCVWLKPALVCQIKFAEWTDDGKLRHPVFIGMRDDKKPKEVVRERPRSIKR